MQRQFYGDTIVFVTNSGETFGYSDIKPKSLKLTEENRIYKTLWLRDKDFLDSTAKVLSINGKNDIWTDL